MLEHNVQTNGVLRHNNKPSMTHNNNGEQDYAAVIDFDDESSMVQASQSHLDLGRAPYVVYGVKYIGLVSLVASTLMKLCEPMIDSDDDSPMGSAARGRHRRNHQPRRCACHRYVG